jgi:hypothetical protein
MNDKGNIRSATAILTELRSGAVITELSDAIHDALAAVKEHGKAGEVILRLKIVPQGDQNNVEPVVSISAEVEKRLPKPAAPATIFFVDAGGNATRQPQERQRDIGFTVAGGAQVSQA